MRKDLMRKFSREYLAKYPSVTKIYDAIAGSRRMGSEVTVEHYVSAVAKFVKYIGFSDPETALKAMQNGEVDAAAKVDSFIDYALDELQKSHSTVRNYVHGVKKWLELNGVKVDWTKIEMPTATETVETDRAPTKEELKILLNHASSSRDRFIINLLTSSGLRIGTLLSLKIGDVDSSPPDVAIVRVEKARGRKFGSKRSRGSGRLYVTFMTPEAKISMQQYLNEREVSGEKLTADSPLITDWTNKGNFITIDAYSKVWARLLKKAGLNQKAHLYHTLHIHTLRKYFRSNCIGVDASYRERWMGHKGLYLDESYFRAEESLHLAEYRKAIPHLTVYAIPTEEKKLRSQMLVDFARLQGYSGDELKKLEDALARSKDVEEAITEFKKLKDEDSLVNTAKPKHIIAKGEEDLLRHLDDGYKMVETLHADTFLLERLYK
jgi:integrase